MKKTEEAIIPCCVCGEAIKPGRSVALYGVIEKEKLREGAKTVSGGRGAIGCLRMRCVESSVNMPGFWDGSVLVIRKDDEGIRDWLEKAFGITGDTVAPDA